MQGAKAALVEAEVVSAAQAEHLVVPEYCEGNYEMGFVALERPEQGRAEVERNLDTVIWVVAGCCVGETLLGHDEETVGGFVRGLEVEALLETQQGAVLLDVEKEVFEELKLVLEQAIAMEAEEAGKEVVMEMGILEQE